MRGADSNEGLPAATLDGACAPPRVPSNAHPHAAVQEMSDLLDADLGRPALEVLTRLCDQGVRPAVLVYMHETRAHDRRALRRSIRRRSRPSYGSYGRNGTRWPRRRRRREESLLGDSAKVKYHLSCILRSGEHHASVL